MFYFFKRVIYPLVIAYILTAAVLYFNQSNMVYAPQKSNLEEALSFTQTSGTTLETFTTHDGIELYFFHKKVNKDAPVILLFSGNAMTYKSSYQKFSPLIQAGYNIAFSIYRGYDINSDSPSQEKLYKDAESIYSALKTLGYKDENIVIYGYSIGSAPAVYLASKKTNARALVVEAGFDSLEHVAAAKYPIFPIKYLLKDKYPSVHFIENATTPKLHIHGRKDSLIPIKHGENLYNKAHEPKEFIYFDNAAHNNINGHKEVIRFLQDLIP